MKTNVKANIQSNVKANGNKRESASASQILENYLFHVGSKLKPSTKVDILKELKANIEDEWEQKIQIGMDPQEALDEILLGMGTPLQVATSYTQSQQALVSPELTELYWLILKFVLMGISIAFTAIGGIELATGTLSVQEITRTVIETLARIWGTGFSAFGMHTLIFILISKKQDKEDFAAYSLETGKEWNQKALYSLKAQPASEDVVKSSEAISALIGVVIGFLILNGITYGSEGNLWMAWMGAAGLETKQFSFLNIQLLKGFMPYVNSLMVISFLLNLYLLIKGKWQIGLRVIHFSVEVLGLVFFLMLWFNPTFFDWTAAESIVGSRIIEGLRISFNITSIVVVIVGVGSAVATMYKHAKAVFFRA